MSIRGLGYFLSVLLVAVAAHAAQVTTPATIATTAYTLGPVDCNQIDEFTANSPSVVTVTVPAGLSPGCTPAFEQLGTATVLFSAGTGMTPLLVNNASEIAGQNAIAFVVVNSASQYTVAGNVIAPPTTACTAAGSTIPSCTTITGTVTGDNTTGASPPAWTVTGGQIYRNGTVDPVTSGVVLLLWYNSNLYQQNSAGTWYEWNTAEGSGIWAAAGGAGWSQLSGDPRG